MASSALVGLPCSYPARSRLADGVIICAIHTSAMIVNHTSHSTSVSVVTVRGRIHGLPVASAKRRTHLKPHSSAVAVPCGMPASRASAASITTPCRTPGLSGKSAYGESCSASRLAMSRAARARAFAAVPG